MSEPIFICKICGEEIYHKHLVQHHTKKHNISHKEYYDKYLKKDGDGICPVCDKETKFFSLWKGYNKHCSTKCSSLDPAVQDKLHKTNLERYNTINGFNSYLAAGMQYVGNTGETKRWLCDEEDPETGKMGLIIPRNPAKYKELKERSNNQIIWTCGSDRYVWIKPGYEYQGKGKEFLKA